MQIVYVLTNPAMPNLVKIGMTTNNLESRIAELSRSTGVPLPFEVYYAAQVNDAQRCESLVHNIFIDKRLNPKREFFSVAPEQVVSALKLAEINNITPQNDIVDSEEEVIALNEARKKREKISLSTINVPIGSILHFVDDNELTCITLENGKVLFDGNELSLSLSANKAFEKMGIIRNYPLQGPAYWIFEGETLVQRRLRLEE